MGRQTDRVGPDSRGLRQRADRDRQSAARGDDGHHPRRSARAAAVWLGRISSQRIVFGVLGLLAWHPASCGFPRRRARRIAAPQSSGRDPRRRFDHSSLEGRDPAVDHRSGGRRGQLESRAPGAEPARAGSADGRIGRLPPGIARLAPAAGVLRTEKTADGLKLAIASSRSANLFAAALADGACRRRAGAPALDRRRHLGPALLQHA